MKRSKRYNQILLERRLEFREEFCEELDIFDAEARFPEWIYQYREPLLDKVSKPLKQLARLLKDCGVKFKMKWPLEIDGQWKYADIYIPKSDTVVTVASKSDYLRPSLFMNDKADFFSRGHNVCQLDYDVFEGGHEKLMELISNIN